LQGLEAKFYSLEVEERSKNTDLEAVNYSNQALMDRNLDLKSEYEALQKHSLLLTQQNKDLQRELDSFVETDDIVRRNLDRKEKVLQIRTKVDSAITESVHHVARTRSPFKGSPVREVVKTTTTHHAVPYQVTEVVKDGGFRSSFAAASTAGYKSGTSYVRTSEFSPARKVTTTTTYGPRPGSPFRETVTVHRK